MKTKKALSNLVAHLLMHASEREMSNPTPRCPMGYYQPSRPTVPNNSFSKKNFKPL